MDFEIRERFLGFLKVSENQVTDFLATMILNFLQQSNVGDSHIVAQSHDGVNVIRPLGRCAS